jgi:hypothetical protein
MHHKIALKITLLTIENSDSQNKIKNFQSVKMTALHNISSDQLKRPTSEYSDKYTMFPIKSVLRELSHAVCGEHDCTTQNYT